MTFFRKGESGLDHIAHRIMTMLGDARHSFDLAAGAVLSGADAAVVGADIRATDDRINRAEQELRGELVVHVAVHGVDDIGLVLAYTLLIKKIERIGDQAKNILDLAEEGVSLAGEPDIETLVAYRRTISALFAETIELLGDPVEDRVADFRQRTDDLRRELETRVRELLHSDETARFAVPRAILYRYWKRIVANLGGVVTSATEPLQHHDYLDGGTTDITDD
ncbi:MAG: PhoU domain-containing protein [Acidimicrobiales bacterium]